MMIRNVASGGRYAMGLFEIMGCLNLLPTGRATKDLLLRHAQFTTLLKVHIPERTPGMCT